MGKESFKGILALRAWGKDAGGIPTLHGISTVIFTALYTCYIHFKFPFSSFSYFSFNASGVSETKEDQMHAQSLVIMEK